MLNGSTLDQVLKKVRKLESFDLVSTKPAYPHGIDYEIFPSNLLEKFQNKPDIITEEMEHILNYAYNRESEFNIVRLVPESNLKLIDQNFLVDTQSDYQNMTNLVAGMGLDVEVVDIIKAYQAKLAG